MPDTRPLLQYVLTTPRRTWGTRVYADGRVDAYSDRRVVLQADGEFATYDRPLQWRPRARLAGAEMQHLVRVIAASGFFALPAHLGTPDLVQDGSAVVWTLASGSRQHQVTAHGRDQQSHPVLEHLRTVFEALVTEALNRDPPGDQPGQ